MVTLRDLTEHQIAQLNSVAVLLGVACFGVGCALAYPLALFFRTPRLVPVAVASCLALITSGVRAVPEGLLGKELRWLSLVNGGCDILAAGITLVLALSVLGTLLAGTARPVLCAFILKRIDLGSRSRFQTKVLPAPAMEGAGATAEAHECGCAC